MIETYLAELSAQLGRRGVRGGRRRRILAEIEDHLRSDPEATARFGDPAEIAQAFANDLGTVGALRAPLWAFAGLAVAGGFYTAMVVAWSLSGGQVLGMHAAGAASGAGIGALQTIARSGDAPFLGLVAATALVLAPQVSFVAGILALRRALRLRRLPSIPAAEVAALRRRTATALASGLASMGAIALFAQQFAAQLPAWSAGVLGWSVVGAAGSAVILVVCGACGLRTAGIRVEVAGTAGDVFDDLGPVAPAALREHPWTLGAGVSVAVGVAVWIAGVAAADPYDGALRGLAEGAACFIGFAVLGRFLAVRA